jgi:predicted MFS family arabinose efflux permease
MIASRLFAGRLVDQGKLTNVIFIGSLICTVTFFLFSVLKEASLLNQALLFVLFYLIALMMGVGYGMMFPAYNTLFVNLAPNNRRATASSTYLTSWDIGIGTGLVLGGHISEYIGFPTTYLVGATLTLMSCIIFKKWTEPHFNKNKLR